MRNEIKETLIELSKHPNTADITESIINEAFKSETTVANDFRRHASKILSDILIKGYSLDRERLADMNYRETYLEHALSEFEEIRESNRLFYQKITDLFATAIDYSAESNITKNFYEAVFESEGLFKTNASSFSEESRELQEIAEFYISYAIDKARSGQLMFMRDWSALLRRLL